MKNLFKLLFIVLVVLSVTLQESEARRQVLRGRKAINRRYLKPLAIPAWAIVVLVAIGQLVIGALTFLFLKVTILDRPLKARYVAAPIEPPQETHTP